MDTLADVARPEHRKTNKMSPKALAIVVAPNLWDNLPPDCDPMQGIMVSNKAAALLQLVLKARMRVHHKIAVP